MDTIMINVQHMSHTYENEEGGIAYALKDISLQIRKGEFVAIIGTNGSGKSTLAKHFNALLLPSEGTVSVCGMRTDDPDQLWNIRQKVGMVFQNPDNQIVAAIVEEDVAFGPENLGVPSDELRQRVDTALERVGMKKFALHAPHLLSGGQKQRIAIAGILAMQSDCIVLDEPTAMLDPQGRSEVMTTLHDLNKKEGITVALITHFMEEAVTANRVIVIHKGTLVMDGTAREVFSHVPELKEMGLDVPVAAEVAYRLQQKGVDLPDAIMTNSELGDALCP